MAMPNKTTENVKKRKAAKISPEEKLYRETVGLMEAVECTDRFERAVLTLQSAADIFGKLGEYKDSAELAQKCRDMAEDAREKGTQAVYKRALKKFDKANYKSDYVDIIEDFNRIKEYNYNVNECEEWISKCEKEIGRLETFAAYKRRGIALVVLAVIIIIFINTPFYPLAKGMVYQSRGEYEIAIVDYKAANGILGGAGNIKECYCALGDEAYKNGEYKKALSYYKKGGNKLNAPEMKRKLEKMLK